VWWKARRNKVRVLQEAKMAFGDVSGFEQTVTPSEAAHETLFQLGLIHATGNGAELDLVAAHKWFNLAAMKGSEEARYRRQELAEVMSVAEIAKAQRAAREWLSRSMH
jgi:uncharacterized protein